MCLTKEQMKNLEENREAFRGLWDAVLIMFWVEREPARDTYMMKKWIWAAYGEGD
jgi:hypothetical protein